MSSTVRIVLANASLAGNPLSGGLWSMLLQYVFGLVALGHDVFWLELFPFSGNQPWDERRVGTFLSRFRRYGLGDRCAVLVSDPVAGRPGLEGSRVYGATRGRVKEVASSADVLWNFACALRPPLLSIFRRRVLVDGDPGHLQVSALSCDLGIHDHHAFLTAGTKLLDPNCEVPRLGVRWQPFVQFGHLPLWPTAADPGLDAPFSSVTEWTWEELWQDGRILSVSKRAAYLAHVEVPTWAGRRFTLAVNIHPEDDTGDREPLQKHGWHLLHPHRVAPRPSAYRRFIRRSRAEFLCPKPIHRALRTGWFSERSAAYLATGRPVVMEDTGVGDHLPTGEGLLLFRDLDEAVATVAEVDAHYPRHARAARELAEAFMDSRRCLGAMVSASFA